MVLVRSIDRSQANEINEQNKNTYLNWIDAVEPNKDQND